MRRRKQSVAEQIAQQLGGTWRAIRDGFGWRYESTDGREVRRYAAPVLDYDGYSDTKFAAVYEESGTGRSVIVV